MAEFAQHATVTQLQRSVTRYDFTLEPPTLDDDRREGHDSEVAQEEPAAKPELVEPASLSMGVDSDGRFRLRYDAPAEVGALVEAALSEAKDHLFHAISRDVDSTNDSGSISELDWQALDGDALDPDWCPTQGGRPRVTWADALIVLATRSLDAAGASGETIGPARRARYRVQVHLDTDGGWLNGRPRLPQHIVNGLTCDGRLTPVWETSGHPVNVGRAQRVVPHRTRVLVLDRDRGCRYPGCASTHHLEIHHLVHWRDGGSTDVTNLLGLCTFHHDGHHRGDFTITGDATDPNGLTFVTRHGLHIGPPQPPPELALAPDPARPGQQASGRPRSRLGKRYPSPSGAPLHLHLVDFTPT